MYTSKKDDERTEATHGIPSRASWNGMAEHSVVVVASASNPKSRYQEKRSKFFSRSVSFPLPLPPHNHEPTIVPIHLDSSCSSACLPESLSFDTTIPIKCTPPSVYYYCFRYKRYRFLGLSFFCSFTSLLYVDGAWMTGRCLVYQYNFHRLCMERRRFGSFGGSGTEFLRHTLQNKTVNNGDLVGRSSWSGNMLYSMVIICCDRTFPPGEVSSSSILVVSYKAKNNTKDVVWFIQKKY